MDPAVTLHLELAHELIQEARRVETDRTAPLCKALEELHEAITLLARRGVYERLGGLGS